MSDFTITIPKDELFGKICETLSEDEIIEFLRFADEWWSNWDFIHKVFMYARKHINMASKEYKEYLECMTDMDGPTIVSIMDSLEDK